MGEVTPIKKSKKRKNRTKECDVLFSKSIRAVGMCESGRLEHAGNLQCAHGFSRRYRATRWDPRNAWCFCAGCHMYFTQRPLEFDEWLYGRWGTVLYLQMRERAMRGDPPDLDEMLLRLKTEVSS